MNDLQKNKSVAKTRERAAVSAHDGLRPFFFPESVAVIGASCKPGNLGGRIVESLQAQGFPGVITIVHPSGTAIGAVPTVRSVDELPSGTDLAILAVPAARVPGLVEPLAKRGVRHLIVIGGGFAENGEKGAQIQNAVAMEAVRHGVRVIGPNGLGVFSAPAKFNSFFLLPGEIAMPETGSVAVISQSGAFLSLILDRFACMGLGIRFAVNFGNRLDVDENELLIEFARDPSVKVIGVYLESFKDGARFVETARHVAFGKPVVIWKGGQGGRGNDAARAHSASLAGSYPVFQSACAKAHLLEAHGFEEFCNALAILSSQPPMQGDRVLIASNGGGMGVFLTDLCQQAGLRVPATTATDLAQIKPLFPDYFSLANPIDLTGSGTNEQCVRAVETLLASGAFDCLLLVLLAGTEGITPEIAHLLKKRIPKHIPFALAAYGRSMFPKMRVAFTKERMPVFASGEAAVQALKVLAQRRQLAQVSALPHHDAYHSPFYTNPDGEWPEWRQREPDEMEVKFLLAKCGVEVPASKHVENREALAEIAERFGYPLVLKAIVPGMKHKSEIEAVRLDLESFPYALSVWTALSKRWPGKIWAEQQLPRGLDLLVGAHRDPQFGTTLVFGWGGKYVEIRPDCGRLLAPAGRKEIESLIDNTAVGKIIRGVRGDPPLNIERLVDFIKLVEEWMERIPQIESLDFNPVRLYRENLVVLDAKASMQPIPRKDG
jgi:acetyltransferase